MLVGSVDTGVEALDRLLDGLLPGDNVVWVADRDEWYTALESSFLEGACDHGHRALFVGATRAAPHRRLPAGVVVIDATADSPLAGPAALAEELERRMAEPGVTCIAVDDLGALARRWGPAAALAFFVRACPTMLQAGAVTYWRVPRSLGTGAIERIRQVTQLLLDLHGHQLRIVKAEGRPGSVQGSVHQAQLVDGAVTLTVNPASGRLPRGLQALRKDLGLTQAQLAAVAGITPSAVSQAESGTRGLSLETLITLTDHLGVGLDRLVNSHPDPGYRLARHDRRRTTMAGGIIPLVDDAAIGLRAFLVVLAGDEDGTPPFEHHGVEFVAVSRGLVQIGVGTDTPVLRSGDSLLTTSATIGSWRNLRADPAVFYWVLRD